MNTAPIFLVLVALTGAYAAEFYSCSWIFDDRVECNSFPNGTICGTDLVSYGNKCYFSQAHCKNTDLHLLHPGACNSIDFQATPIPAHGADVALDFFCTSLSHMSCGSTLAAVCATDGRTYPNSCEFEKAKCTHRDLHVSNFGACPP